MNIEIQRKMKYREMIKKDDVIRLSVHWHVTLCRVHRKCAAEIQVFQSKMKSFLSKNSFYIIFIQMFLTKSNTRYIFKKMYFYFYLFFFPDINLVICNVILSMKYLLVDMELTWIHLLVPWVGWALIRGISRGVVSSARILRRIVSSGGRGWIGVHHFSGVFHTGIRRWRCIVLIRKT